jgi:hypothetical protein
LSMAVQPLAIGKYNHWQLGNTVVIAKECTGHAPSKFPLAPYPHPLALSLAFFSVSLGVSAHKSLQEADLDWLLTP